MLALEELTHARRLKLELVVAHLDHSLRAESAEDARWVEQQARAHGFEASTRRIEVGERARAGRDNLEQAARRARYEFLAATARERGAQTVLTAHTLDDQAETILLRLLRGSGADGLGGMRAERRLEGGEDTEANIGVVEANAEVVLRRPLLNWARRADTEGYCRERGVEPRADEMNEDERFARVRVRRALLPLLETFNPRAVESLARAARLLREDSSALESLAAELLEEARAQSSTASGSSEGSDERAARVGDEGAWPLRVEVLASAHTALRRRALRLWLARGRGDLRRLELAHLVAIERLLEGTRGGRVAELPGGCRVERRRGLLVYRGKEE